MSGTGWTIDLPNKKATRSDLLAVGATYPVITVTVNVTADAPTVVTNMATVSGGSEFNTTNDTASDPTTVVVVTPSVLGVSPSLSGGTLIAGATTLTVNFNIAMTGANLASNFELRSTGADGLLGTADDPILPSTLPTRTKTRR